MSYIDPSIEALQELARQTYKLEQKSNAPIKNYDCGILIKREDEYGLILKRDCLRILSACNTIRNAFHWPPSSGMTIDNKDYLPLDWIEEPQDFRDAVTFLYKNFCEAENA